VRTWLHRIATNACLDLLARQQRRHRLLMAAPADDTGVPAPVAVSGLQPYPDRLLDEAADTAAERGAPTSPSRRSRC
jgi:RNA polymerase sigma-70 factor, ECF subfamily